MSEQQSRGSRTQRKWLWGYVGVIALCALLTYTLWFLWGYVPLSTLPVMEDVGICDKKIPPFWPLTARSPYSQFPVFSPDGRHYITVDRARYRDAEEMRLYESDTNRFLGRYSYHNLYIFCWAADGSGVYVADDVDCGFSGMMIGIPDFGLCTLWNEKSVLVPCQSKLDGVSFVPRLYWEMRCAFPQPHGFVAVWLPLVVVAALVVLTGWLGFKGVSHGWRRWIRPW